MPGTDPTAPRAPEPGEPPNGLPTIGDLELDTLRYVAEAGPVTVRQAAIGFGQPRGLARTTVLTMMERLRVKGYLARRKEGAVYQYSARVAAADVLKGLVREFVDRTLGGSLTPFVAYLSESHDLTDDEVAQLRRLVDSLPKGAAGGAA